MGKWCEVKLPDNFQEELNELLSESEQQIYQDWVAIAKPPLSYYGLEWYRGGSGGGWMCIDDSKTTKVFKMLVDETLMPSKQDYYEQLACVLANQLGMSQCLPIDEQIALRRKLGDVMVMAPPVILYDVPLTNPAVKKEK